MTTKIPNSFKATGVALLLMFLIVPIIMVHMPPSNPSRHMPLIPWQSVVASLGLILAALGGSQFLGAIAKGYPIQNTAKGKTLVLGALFCGGGTLVLILNTRYSDSDSFSPFMIAYALLVVLYGVWLFTFGVRFKVPNNMVVVKARSIQFNLREKAVILQKSRLFYPKETFRIYFLYGWLRVRKVKHQEEVGQIKATFFDITIRAPVLIDLRWPDYSRDGERFLEAIDFIGDGLNEDLENMRRCGCDVLQAIRYLRKIREVCVGDFGEYYKPIAIEPITPIIIT